MIVIKINILRYIDGARTARGIAVIIDVFRAFSFECYAVENNIKKIIPVASKELAYKLKKENPKYILAGERKGIMLPNFDYGNSPSQIKDIDLSNKVLVHTTSAGTQGLENAVNADEIITGSLVNSSAVANYIRKGDFEEVSLVCMGNNGTYIAEEDELCGWYIKNLLESNECDISVQMESLKFTAGRKFFDPSTNMHFPQQDFYLCTALNRFDFVLKFEYDHNGIGYIKKI